MLESVEYTEKLFVTDIDHAKIHLIKFSDEERLSMNWISGGKLLKHTEIPLERNVMWRIWELDEGQEIKALGHYVKCVSVEKDYF